MMHLKVVLGIAIAAFSSAAFAVGEAFVPDYVPGTCIVDGQDPFEPDQRMESGPLKGLCINPVQRRSVDILEPDLAAKYFEVREGDMVIANFSHQGKFWIARIPVAAASKVMMLLQYFPIGNVPVLGPVHVAHTQWRFQFAGGEKILLKPQSRETVLATPALALNEMIFSVENIGPFGEKFDAMKGLKGHYHIAYRAISLADKYKWMVTDQGHEVRQVGIRLAPADVSRLLALSLTEGERYGTRRNYGTLGPNCSTELFVLLDRLTGSWLWSRPFLPNSAINALAARGLLEPKALPTFNEEFAGGGL